MRAEMRRRANLSAETHNRASFSISRTVRKIARARRLALIEAWLYRPCFVRDALMRSIPSAVRGPVLGARRTARR